MIEDGLSGRSFADLSTSALHAEIIRRQTNGDRPQCGGGVSLQNYNTGLHVFALILILILSTLACSFPIIVRRYPRLPVPNYSLFISRHFGTGTLIAVAFVHLLPTAYVSLTDPCLPDFWNKTYPPMAGFIAMVSMLVVVAVEMFFATQGAGHSHGIDFEPLRGSGDYERVDRRGHASSLRRGDSGLRVGTQDDDVPLTSQRSPYSDSPGTTDKPLPSLPAEDRENDSDLDLDELDPLPSDEDTAPLNGGMSFKRPDQPNGHTRPSGSRHVSFADPPSALPDSTPISRANDQRLVLQCLMLEAGILFHSVFIGLALSVTAGGPFVVLLIAIAFHQTFEGLALGSRIAAIPSFSTASVKPWLMSFMYGVTTPIGQAIGLAVHTLYDPASQFGLLTVGIVNAISSGLLLYAGLVQLLAEDFLSDKSYETLKGRRRLEACGAVFVGSMLMAFVGAFA